MRRNLPPLNSLLAFDAAARLGSFTKAARELGVSQPAVTRHINNLETWLGATLFHRHGNTIMLTPAGEALADVSEASLDRLELGIRRLPAVRDDELVIGASFGITHLYLMPRLAAIRAATALTINFLTSDHYVDFRPGNVDLSIRFGDGDFGDLQADLLFAEECYVIAAPSFLENTPAFDPSDPLGTVQPHWMLEHGDPSNIGWMTWDRWFRYFGHETPARTGRREIRNYPAMLEMVRNGDGLAIGSVGLEDSMVATGEIIRIGPKAAREAYGYYLVYPQDIVGRPAFEALRTSLSTGQA